MRNENQKCSGWIIVLAVVVLLAIVIGVAKTTYPRKPINITMATNGVAHVYGIPLGNAAIRLTVFAVIKVLKPKEVRIGIVLEGDQNSPPSLPPTNMVSIAADLKRAGLVPPPRPNPYE